MEEKFSVKHDDFVKLMILLNQLTTPIFNKDDFTIHIESKRGANSVKITYDVTTKTPLDDDRNFWVSLNQENSVLSIENCIPDDAEHVRATITPQNPALPLVKKIKHIHVRTLDDMKAAADLLATGRWIAISAAVSGDGADYLLMLGRVV